MSGEALSRPLQPAPPCTQGCSVLVLEREVRSPHSLTCCLCKVGRIRLSLPSCGLRRGPPTLWGQLSPHPVHLPSILFIFYTEHGEIFLKTNQIVFLPQLLGRGSAGCSP